MLQVEAQVARKQAHEQHDQQSEDRITRADFFFHEDGRNLGTAAGIVKPCRANS